jgi:hypothetical protein
MRRYTILISLLLLLPFLGANVPSPDRPCDPKALIEGCKKELPPYSYSSSRRIITHTRASNEISVTLLKGEEYRLVFHKEHLPDGSVIRIYDGPEEESGRSLLKSSMDTPRDRKTFVFDPRNEDGEDIYISYDIPEPEGQACFAFVVGYKLSFLED